MAGGLFEDAQAAINAFYNDTSIPLLETKDKLALYIDQVIALNAIIDIAVAQEEDPRSGG